MRWVLRIVFVAVVLWLAYWFAAAFFIKSQFASLLDEARTRGIEAEAELSLSGAPARFDLQLKDIALYDPDQGLGWQSPEAALSAEAWAPWHLVAILPKTQRLVLQGQSFDLESENLRSSLKLRPLPDLPLADWRLSSERIALSSHGARVFASGSAIVALRRAGGNFYQFGGDLAQIELPAKIVQALAATDIPPSIESLKGSLMAELTAPLDSTRLQSPFGAKALKIEDIRILWGEMQIAASGELRADAQGFAEGRLALAVTGWQQLPPLLSALGVLPAGYVPLIGNLLASLAKQNGGESLAIELVAKGGKLMLGPIAIAAAPRMIAPEQLP